MKCKALLALFAMWLSAADAAEDATHAKPGAIEEILVTAKKRAQDVQNVPQTVDVVSATTLSRFNAVEFQDLQQLVSGLQLSDNGGQGQNISLRGVTYDPDTAANPAVDTYINEVPLSQTSTAFQDLYDIDAVQVIRGPQGNLRGRTSPAGAILIDTKRPSMEGSDGYISQDFSDNGLFRTQLAGGMAIIPGKLAVRLAGLFDQNDLYGTGSLLTRQKDFNLQHSGRLTLEAAPGTLWHVVVMHQESNDRTRELFGVSGSGQSGSISPAQNLSLLAGPYTFYNRTNITTIDARRDLGGSELNYNGGFQAVRDEFQNYAEKGGLFRGFNTGSQLLDQSVGTLSQEVRLQSAGDQRLGYMLGLYYLHQSASAQVFTPSEIVFAVDPSAPYPGALPLANINARVTIPQLETDYAIFSDETFKITPDDVIEGGLRWQLEKQYRASAYTVAIPPIFGGGTFTDQLVSPSNQHEEYRAWTGLASYTHHFTAAISLYSNYGQSFRPGGVVLGVSLPLPENFLIFKPETSYDFEIGGKMRLYGGRLRLAADVFDQAYTNYIGRENNVFTTLGYQSLTTNGNALTRGFETSALARITAAWRMEFNTTFTDARYDRARLPCNDFAATGQPNTNGAPRVIGVGITSTCLTSDPLGAPNWFLSANTEYEFALPYGAAGFVRALYSFTPRNRLALQTANQDPRNLLNIYAGVNMTSRWEAFIFVKNILNLTGSTNLFGEQYDSGFTTAGQPVNFDTRYASSDIVRPRELGINLTYRF